MPAAGETPTNGTSTVAKTLASAEIPSTAKTPEKAGTPATQGIPVTASRIVRVEMTSTSRTLGKQGHGSLTAATTSENNSREELGSLPHAQ